MFSRKGSFEVLAYESAGSRVLFTTQLYDYIPKLFKVAPCLFKVAHTVKFSSKRKDICIVEIQYVATYYK